MLCSECKRKDVKYIIDWYVKPIGMRIAFTELATMRSTTCDSCTREIIQNHNNIIVRCHAFAPDIEPISTWWRDHSRTAIEGAALTKVREDEREQIATFLEDAAEMIRRGVYK